MKYRNISGETMYVPVLRPARVGDGEIADFPDDYPCYVQTGETGEPALWELIKPPTTKKTATAEKE